MGLSSFGATDSNYSEYMRHMLLAYGVSSSECDARIGVYRSKGNARHGLQRGKKVSAAQLGLRAGSAERASVEAASMASRVKMSGLEGSLGARFARGPRPPPAPGACNGGRPQDPSSNLEAHR